MPEAAPPRPLREKLLSWTPAQRQEYVDSLTREEQEQLQWDWEGVWARDKQLAPSGDWWTWALITGRGWGKTATLTNFLLSRRRQGGRLMGVMAESNEEAWNYIIRGPAGFLSISPPWDYPVTNQKGRGRVIYPATKQIPWQTEILIFSGEKPRQVRGAGMDTFGIDEYAKYRGAGSEEVLDSLAFSMRGEGATAIDPKVCIATTPLPTKAIRDLMAADDTVVTTGSLYENESNLPAAYVAKIRKTFEGTTLGEQEIYGRVLAQRRGALWTIANLAKNRGILSSSYKGAPARPPLSEYGKRWMIFDTDKQVYRAVPDFVCVATGVDPAGSLNPASGADIGIITCALGEDEHIYILEDSTCLAGASPGEWGAAANNSYWKWGANAAAPEKNFGGAMVEHTMRTSRNGKNVNIIPQTASHGKQPRAQPFATLSEQGRLHILGDMPELEQQLCTWVPGEKSPDRLDAMVWACTYLMPMEAPSYVTYISDGMYEPIRL